MKLKKFLSLILATGSLATAPTTLSTSAISGLAEIKNLQYSTSTEDIYMYELYLFILNKRFAPVKNGGDLLVCKIYLQRVIENLDEYKEDIASFYKTNKITNEQIEEFENICRGLFDRIQISNSRRTREILFNENLQAVSQRLNFDENDPSDNEADLSDFSENHSDAEDYPFIK